MPKIPLELRRNPEAPHVKAYALYRLRKGKPKATTDYANRPLPPSRGQPLSYVRYEALVKDYQARAEADLKHKRGLADGVMFDYAKRYLRGEAVPEFAEFERVTLPLRSATISTEGAGYAIANEIIKEFRRTRGLRVFGFGEGYGQLSFVLSKFMGIKVRGVDLGNFSSTLTKSKRLGIIHGKSVGDKSLRKLGKFDVTFSSWVFENDILQKKEDRLAMLDNMAEMTRKGGKSYHVIQSREKMPVSIEEVEARGFKVDKIEESPSGSILIKLTKVRD